MTTTTVSTDIETEVDLELEMPCTLRWVNIKGRVCDNPAAWAFSFKCCGYTKVICEYHYQEGLTGTSLVCRGCKREWGFITFAECAISIWRI